ncbi:hypothetical protein [Anthocerotibacter panamensis]|uniref:hypothetical protein n=1 Tax=Anthocerotibacter panamensis TaxID=2857077 RepID=UPI001C406881|nr:hypothetical protein [Anthocerotibacter panamensis]
MNSNTSAMALWIETPQPEKALQAYRAWKDDQKRYALGEVRLSTAGTLYRVEVSGDLISASLAEVW